MASNKSEQAIEKRLQLLEDREEIMTLLIEYGRRLDRKDWAAYSELFAEDGKFISSGGVGVASGRTEIRELCAKVLKDVPAGFHLYSNISIELDGDRATSRSYVTYLNSDDAGGPQIPQVGHYDDILVREKGRWRIQQRESTRDIGSRPY